jgi:hypothetical protein
MTPARLVPLVCLLALGCNPTTPPPSASPARYELDIPLDPSRGGVAIRGIMAVDEGG